MCPAGIISALTQGAISPVPFERSVALGADGASRADGELWVTTGGQGAMSLRQSPLERASGHGTEASCSARAGDG